MDHKIELNDGLKSSDKAGAGAEQPVTPVLKTYEVLADSGLFKGGKHYSKGEQIQLVEQAAANFLTLKEIKEIES